MSINRRNAQNSGRFQDALARPRLRHPSSAPAGPGWAPGVRRSPMANLHASSSRRRLTGFRATLAGLTEDKPVKWFPRNAQPPYPSVLIEKSI
jgi:hypothetical protein